MNLWFTRRGAKITRTHVKRFDPLHWSVDFPRGTIASIVTTDDAHGLEVWCEFLRKGDLVGLIWESEDRLAHPAHARETSRDYSHCQLKFRWQSSGVMALDAANGPTLTIEGTDGAGAARSWFVRLWNYASGSPTDAVVTLDFDALDGGFGLPANADRVVPTRIDRMFISLVAPGYVEGSGEMFPAPVQGSVTLSAISCDGSGSVLAINDAMVPEHVLRIATAYDDSYNVPPERLVQAAERLGYRKVINHYIGMSHYFALTGAGTLDPSRTFNSAALEWHRGLAKAATERGYDLIWSLSYEILDMFCPDAWKQRAYDGSPALTGWVPPSALVSPAKAALGGDQVEIADVRGTLDAAQIRLLDDAGTVLAASTASIAAAVKAVTPDAKTLLLAYLPTVLDEMAPKVQRANLPVGWAKPAFDVLQLEDYDWVTAGRNARRDAAYTEVELRLGYPRSEQHYLSGFVAAPEQRGQWRNIVDAATDAVKRGCAEVFLWALPQVLRDGLTIFGKEQAVVPFDDVSFPIEIGQEASVAPAFSTSIVASASGHESRNANWAQARLRFDAGPGVRGDAELEALIRFFRARRGPAVGFRFRDPYDHSSNGMTAAPTAFEQTIGNGDGATDSFALAKDYGSAETRPITRPVPGSVRVAVDGAELSTGWTLGAKGRIEFAAPPATGASVTAGFLFDVPVRFAEDRIEVNRATFLAGEAPSIPLIEVRED